MTAVFPELAPLGRPAIRLHPRPGTVSPYESSVGGPLLWPAGEPWPICREDHTGSSAGGYLGLVRLERRSRARLRLDPGGDSFPTPEAQATMQRLDAALMERYEPSAKTGDTGLPPPVDESVAMLPVAQLYVRDVPLLRPPAGADLLQVLWCPLEHEPENKPLTMLFWRSAAEIADVGGPPEWSETDSVDEWYVPEPCALAPERITEYPCTAAELGEELWQRLGDVSRWQAAGVTPAAFRPSGAKSGSHVSYPDSFYRRELSVAPGWKVGGWPPWGVTDPCIRFCAACDAEMVPLLTVASGEWDSGNRGWVPREDQAVAALGRADGSNPPEVVVGRSNHLQLYVCPRSPEHPHTDLIQ